MFTSSSGSPGTMTTLLGGLVGTVTALPLSGVYTINGLAPSGGQLDLSTATIVGQPLPADAAITGISAFGRVDTAMNLIGTTLTVTAQVWQSSDGNIYSPVPGASVTLAPALTGSVTVGDTMAGSMTGLAVPVSQGTSLVVVFSATASGVSVVNTVSARLSSGVAMGPAAPN